MTLRSGLRSADSPPVAAITQVSLLPPPCDELTTSEPLLQGHARQAARQHVDVFAVQDVRPQIDVPALEVVADDRRDAGQRQASVGRCSCAGSRWISSANRSRSSCDAWGPISMP